jgi:large subunit ribosomal protein L13
MRTRIVKSDVVVNIDASGRTLGRVCSEAALALMGKKLPSYRPNVLAKVAVVIKNVGGLRFTGSKLDTKLYQRFSGYPGGIKESTLRQEFEKHPDRLIRRAIERMLPKNRLVSRRMRYLTVYMGEEK